MGYEDCLVLHVFTTDVNASLPGSRGHQSRCLKPFCLYTLFSFFGTGRSARFYTFEYDITIWIAIDFEIATSVLVWFHGGGLASGMAGMYEPHFIMDYQVFLVFQTQNLRIKYRKSQLQGGRCDSELPPRSLGGAQPGFWQGFRKSRIEGPGWSQYLCIPVSPFLIDQFDNQN